MMHVAFLQKVAINCQEFSKWTGVRAYAQKFLAQAFDKPEDDDGKATMPLDPASLKAFINSIEPEPETPSDDDEDDEGTMFKADEHQKQFQSIATESNVDAVKKLQATVVGKPVRLQAEAINMVTTFWEECRSVKTYHDFAGALLSAMSRVVATDVWHLLSLLLFDRYSWEVTSL